MKIVLPTLFFAPKKYNYVSFKLNLTDYIKNHKINIPVKQNDFLKLLFTTELKYNA